MGLFASFFEEALRWELRALECNVVRVSPRGASGPSS